MSSAAIPKESDSAVKALTTATSSLELIPLLETGGDCPICQEPMKDAVVVLPCKHVFSLHCIRYWVATRFPRPITCPSCRTVITHVLLNVGKDDKRKIPWRELITDEDVAAASQEQQDFSNLAQDYRRIIWQLQQWMRVEARGIVSVKYPPVEYHSVAAEFEGGVAEVSRHLSLKVVQEGIQTKSTLQRWLRIKYYKASHPRTESLRRMTNSSSSQSLERARQEVVDFRKEWGENRRLLDIPRGTYTRPEQILVIGDRGIQQVKLLKKAETWERPTCLRSSGEANVKIVWTTVLKECGPTRPDGDPQTFDIGEDRNVLRTRWKVRIATEQIRSALVLLSSPGSNDQRSSLDRFTTNILETCPSDAVQCGKCMARHIGGYCIEQWSLIWPP
jgi:hypothetical protein